MKKSLATLLTALILFSCGWTPACIAEPTETDAVWEQVSEAYIYAFPLVLTNATKTMSTNTDGSVTGRAPVNQINHAKKLADASFRTVVTPNVDTLYSQAWLDIGAEPMVYLLPETDRFCNVQLLDAWTNTAAVLDRAGAYAIALPSWAGELPENVTRVDVPTETVCSPETRICPTYTPFRIRCGFFRSRRIWRAATTPRRRAHIPRKTTLFP